MLKREQWIELARDLDWERSYVADHDAFPPAAAGEPRLSEAEWNDCRRAERAPFGECIALSRAADGSHGAGARSGDAAVLDPGYRSAVKLHAAGLPLREFVTVTAHLRAARFARTSRWRAAGVLSALEALRRTQAPLLALHERIASDAQFEWTHRLAHSEHWFAIAARHFADDLLLGGDPLEVAVTGGFVETSFNDVQAAILARLAGSAGDRSVETLLHGMRTTPLDERTQIGRALMELLVARDRVYAQDLVDKWFWRSWLGFAVVTGSAVDYLVPLAQRGPSFKELVEESLLPPFLRALADVDLKAPWYWPELLEALGNYHHMAYASLYTYRRTLWFHPVLPGPEERAWLRAKYPRTWDGIDPIWARIAERWNQSGPGVEWYAHATSPAGLCNLCQLPLCAGTPQRNSACTRVHAGQTRIFCSEPCAFIFEHEPARYAAHRDLVARGISGEAPGNLLELITRYFGLSRETSGRDAYGGHYAWLESAMNAPSAELAGARVTTRPTHGHPRSLGRNPSEYDIASSRLSYSVERECAVQTPLSAWYRAQREACALRCDDWERFRDPRATTHARYAALQDKQERHATELLESIEGTDYDGRLSGAWVSVLDRVLAPLRYPAHGLQMLASHLGATAPCGRVVVTSLLQAADETRRVDRLAYRLGQLQQTYRECGHDSRALWERDPGWQPMRELIEHLLVVYEWGEAFVAVNAVLKPAFDQLFMRDLARLAGAAGDHLLVQLLLSLHEDCAWHQQWSSALVAMLVQEDAGNARAMAVWVERWQPRVEAAVDAVIALLDLLLVDSSAGEQEVMRSGRDRATAGHWASLGLPVDPGARGRSAP